MQEAKTAGVKRKLDEPATENEPAKKKAKTENKGEQSSPLDPQAGAGARTETKVETKAGGVASAGSGAGSSGDGSLPVGSTPKKPAQRSPKERALARILKDWESINKSKEFTCKLVSQGDMFAWDVSFKFAADHFLQLQLDAKVPSKSLTLRIRFPETYPLDAPMCNILSPRLASGYIFGGGGADGLHLGGGVICNDSTTVAGWSPATKIETVITGLQSIISQWRYALDEKEPNKAYTDAETQAGFATLRSAHPDWFKGKT